MKSVFGKSAAHVVRTLLCGTALAIFPQMAAAQAVPEDEMFEISVPNVTYSEAVRVSSDGSVVIGTVYSPTSGFREGFRWTADGGVETFGTLGGVSSYVSGISDDGGVVVGYSYLVGDLASRGFRWTADGGLQTLSTLGGDYSEATAVSGDGRIVIGQAYYAGNVSTQAVLWNAAGDITRLGSLGGDYTYAQSISRNGEVIAGYGSDEGGYARAFRWTEGTGMVKLVTLGGRYSSAIAISRDGAVIVGQSSNSDNRYSAVRWTADGNIDDLGTLGGNSSYSKRVSSDGSAVTGSAFTVENRSHAFRWTEAGGMQDLGTLGGEYSYGEDISGDGGVVVGESGTAMNETHAFRWTEAGGMQDLGTLGGSYSRATAVSEDGSTIVGSSYNADGEMRAFIYRTQMQDFTNMIGSFALLANDLTVAMEYQRETASWLMERNCSLRSDQRFCIGTEGMLNFTSPTSSPAIDQRRDAAAKVSLGARLSSAVTVGAGVSIVDYRNEIGAITPDKGYAYAAWLSYAPAGSSLLGLKARAGVSFADQKNLVERGIGLDNVEVTAGRTTIKSSVARGEVGYGLSVGAGAVVTPIAAVTWQNSKMNGFDEAAGDFPASFAGQNFDSVYGTAGVEISIPATESGRFTLAGKADFDLSHDTVAVVGTSTIPNLEQFAIPSGVNRKDVRGKVEAGYAHQVGPGVVSVNTHMATPTYGSRARFGVGVGFNVGF